MALSYAFGGNTGLSYEDLQRRRMFAEGLMQRGMATQPKTGMEGLNSAASSIMGALLAKKLGAEETKNREAATSAFQDAIYGGGMGGQSMPTGSTPFAPPPVDPNSPSMIGADAMRALGKQPMLPTKEEIAAYIQTAAQKRGIDPAVALRVAESEGLNANPNEAWQSNFVKNGKREESYGPFQLYMGGGLGNQFVEQTGMDPRNPSTWQPQVDFALDHASKNGWGSWYGAGRVGIGNMDGIGGVNPKLMEAMANPYLSEGQRSVLGMMLQRQIEASDPANQLALQKSQLEIQQMLAPQPGFRMATPEEAQAYGGPGQIGPDNRYYPAGSEGRGTPAVFEALKLRAAAAGLQEGTPEYEQFMLTGGGGIGESRPAAFEALHQQALAAGLQEGSPDYQKFMLTKGAGDAAAAKAVGEQQGAATAAAPAEIAAADETLGYIAEVRNHVGLDRGTGLSSIFNAVPGTKGYDFKNRVKQLSSGAFLTAIDQLRGMGSLSNAEGQTATAAVTRLDTATSKEEFLSALSDYERIVNMGRARAEARVKSGKNASATPPAGSTYTYNPATGELE